MKLFHSLNTEEADIQTLIVRNTLLDLMSFPGAPIASDQHGVTWRNEGCVVAQIFFQVRHRRQLPSRYVIFPL
jgi:hypothetical protein